MQEIENKLRLFSLPPEAKLENVKAVNIEQHYLKQNALVFSLIRSTATSPGRLNISNPDDSTFFEINVDEDEYLELSKVIPVSSFFGQRVLSKPSNKFCARFRITTKGVSVSEEFTLKGPTSDPQIVEEANVSLPVGSLATVLSGIDKVNYFNPYPVSKTRVKIPSNNGLFWEVDTYHEELEGLYTAEKEIPTLETGFGTPPSHWDYIDITGVNDFKNATLSRNGNYQIK